MSVEAVLTNFSDLESSKEVLSLRGRVVRVRSMRQYWFADVFQEGHQIQLVGATSQLPKPPPVFSVVEVAGRAGYTKTGQQSIEVLEWRKECKGSSQVSREYLAGQQSSYEQLYTEAVASAHALGAVRDFFRDLGFHEVLTPLILDSFNGGNSFPVTAVVNEKRVGFIRTTLEERMLGLVGVGMERIYQIGSIARSFNESVFLEAYAARVSFEEGIELIERLLSAVAQKATVTSQSTNDIRERRWEYKTFADIVTDVFDGAVLLETGADLAQALLKYGIVNKCCSPETAADMLANFYASRVSTPLFITHLPVWSSPLYAVDPKSHKGGFLLRGRGYLPEQEGSFDFGVQETDPEALKTRIELQRSQSNSPTPVEQVPNFAVSTLERGLPSVFGIGLSFPRLVRIVKDSKINSLFASS